MAFGFMARRFFDEAKKNAPPRKFNDGDLVRGLENVAFIGKKMVMVEGQVSDAEYTTSRGPVDLDWQYRILDAEKKMHFVPEERLELVSRSPESLSSGPSVEKK